MIEARLRVNGVKYGGWTDIRIQLSIEQIAGQFELSVTDRWSGQDEKRPIVPGDECELRIADDNRLVDDKPVITGYVDDVQIAYDSQQHTVSVSGRDKTGDLVDCTAAPIQWFRTNLFDGAERLTEPFGIKVTADLNVDTGGPFQKLTVNPADKVFDVLDAAAKIRGVLMISDGLGGLLFTRASKQSLGVVLSLGKTFRSCSAALSHKDCFSNYRVLSQGPGNDQVVGYQASQISAKTTDERIKRYRPLDILAEATDLDAAQSRVEWERNMRFGRSQRAVYTVDGWHYAPGKLWPLNRLVKVNDSFLQWDGVERLIVGTTFILDAEGLRTELALSPREAFDLVPLPEGNSFESLG